MVRKTEGKEKKGTTEHEMAGWHHQINGHELEQTPGDSEGQGSLACHTPWGHKELDTTLRLKNNNPIFINLLLIFTCFHFICIGQFRYPLVKNVFKSFAIFRLAWVSILTDLCECLHFLKTNLSLGTQVRTISAFHLGQRLNTATNKAH